MRKKNNTVEHVFQTLKSSNVNVDKLIYKQNNIITATVEPLIWYIVISMERFFQLALDNKLVYDGILNELK